jgi:hypothetical protein
MGGSRQGELVHGNAGRPRSRIIAPGDQKGLESILQYFEWPPVSLKRLTYLDTGMVHY